ncbi:adenylate kinase-like kinase [Cylindrospermum stagnale PCC 7417]|uniref:Adenylate kinase-like kinase n=1 Tax=Cylindrospermum stagnale PCC 7417 TaxID=56107 RepID=K9WX39_9NOST|nr:AAA family ATPase [Cylindrospermum stagnale]AFZ24366.1 adenylate kinase-like kinase [Cylindrospermum stagnale PCC 7417]
MQRISVVGTSGTGKTTLAKQISQSLAIPHVELDYLHWEPNWVEAPNDVMRERVSQALSGSSWVVDGNYSQVRDIVWGQADTIIWLDYSFTVVMSRVIRRTWHRVVTQQEVCNGNRETWKTTFSKDSIILWALTSFPRNRRQFPPLFAQPEYSHLRIVHLESPKAAQNWLSSL